jgi:hypothetical protein
MRVKLIQYSLLHSDGWIDLFVVGGMISNKLYHAVD